MTTTPQFSSCVMRRGWLHPSGPFLPPWKRLLRMVFSNRTTIANSDLHLLRSTGFQAMSFVPSITTWASGGSVISSAAAPVTL